MGLDCGSGGEEGVNSYFYARLSSENCIDGAPHRAFEGMKRKTSLGHTTSGLHWMDL